MEKYNGNQKGFIYVSCDDANQKEIIDRYLEPLAKDDVSFWWADSFDSKEEKNLARASAALIFLRSTNSKALSISISAKIWQPWRISSMTE